MGHTQASPGTARAEEDGAGQQAEQESHGDAG